MREKERIIHKSRDGGEMSNGTRMVAMDGDFVGKCKQ